MARQIVLQNVEYANPAGANIERVIAAVVSGKVESGDITMGNDWPHRSVKPVPVDDLFENEPLGVDGMETLKALTRAGVLEVWGYTGSPNGFYVTGPGVDYLKRIHEA